MIMFNLILAIKKCLKTKNVFLFRAVDVIFFTWIKWTELKYNNNELVTICETKRNCLKF